MHRYQADRIVIVTEDYRGKETLTDWYAVTDRFNGSEEICRSQSMDKALKVAGALNFLESTMAQSTLRPVHNDISHESVPMTIVSDASYDKWLRELNRLMDLDIQDGTPDAERLEKVALALEKYEEKRWPMSSGGGSGVAALSQQSPDPQ